MSPTLCASPWPRRFVAAAAAALVPLYLFGGTVTTVGAGMAVQGWWNAEGHFLPLFPVEKWFRDLHTFVEHSHRQFGLAVGLLMLAACASVGAFDRRRSARVLVVGTTVAIAVQGWLGGSRVLEASPALAFLHGTFAQAVFALIACVWVHQSRTWLASSPRSSVSGRQLARAAKISAVLVFTQSAVGAWYRHGLRTGLRTDALASVEGRLQVHLFGALLVLASLAFLAQRLRTAAEETSGADAARLRAFRRWVFRLLFAQFALGFLAWGAHGEGSVGFGEWAFATLHVFLGAALLSICAATALWSRRAGLVGEAELATAALELRAKASLGGVQ